MNIGVLGQTLVEAGQLEQAGSILDSASSLHQPPQAIGERVIAFSRALFAEASGDLETALSLVTELFQSIESAGPDQPEGAGCRLFLLRGMIYAGLGRADDARADYQSAMAAAKEFGERPSLWRLHAAMARLFEAQGNTSEAEAQRALGRQVVSDLAADVPEAELRATFVREAERRLSGAPISILSGN